MSESQVEFLGVLFSRRNFRLSAFCSDL